MKKSLYSAFVLIPLLALSQTGFATVILSDNFTVTANSNDPNLQIANGRQSGTSSTSTYRVYGAQHQTGNTGTDVGQPVVSDGNYLLLGGSGGVQNTLEITNALTGGKPLTISFDMYVTGANANNAGFDPTAWTAFTLRIMDQTAPTSGPTGFGMLARYNGGVQFFNNGVKFDQPAGYSTSSSWSFTFSDTAGTGSPFAGNGSKVTFVNGLNTGTIALSQLSTTGGLYVGFQNLNNNFGGIDNLVIATAVPEPSTLACLAVAGFGVLAFRRLRRA
jgi:hypothetical protein